MQNLRCAQMWQTNCLEQNKPKLPLHLRQFHKDGLAAQMQMSQPSPDTSPAPTSPNRSRDTSDPIRALPSSNVKRVSEHVNQGVNETVKCRVCQTPTSARLGLCTCVSAARWHRTRDSMTKRRRVKWRDGLMNRAQPQLRHNSTTTQPQLDSSVAGRHESKRACHVIPTGIQAWVLWHPN